MGEYHLEDESWDEAWGNRNIKPSEVKDKDNRLFVFIHGNDQDQQNFLVKAIDNKCFAQPINFMILQAGMDLFKNKIYFQGKEIIDKKEKENLWNGTRPYLTISNANPDHIGNYYNWSYLESIIETGWKKQFLTNKRN